MKNPIFLSLVLVLMPLLAAAQGTGGSQANVMLLLTMSLVIVVALLVLAVAIYVLNVLKAMVSREEAERKGVTVEELQAEQESMWDKLNQTLTDTVPIEEEKDILMDHSYDGIRELDNHLPPWWKWLFYVTIIFGVVYLLNYHVFKVTPLQVEEYEIAMASAEAELEERRLAAAEEGKVTIDETTVQLVDDPSALANGEQIYVQLCSPCHMNDGGGGIGPNLTDDYWIHGGSIASIFSTIKYGVTEKGMISWQNQINPSDMQDVSSFIYNLRGTTPANPKEAQGELYVPEAEPATETEAAVESAEATDD